MSARSKRRMSGEFLAVLFGIGATAVIFIFLIIHIQNPTPSWKVRSIVVGEYDNPSGDGTTYHTSLRFCLLIAGGYYGLVETSWQPKTGPKRFDTALCLRRGIFSLPYPAPVVASLIGGCFLMAVSVPFYLFWRGTEHLGSRRANNAAEGKGAAHPLPGAESHQRAVSEPIR